MTTLNISDVIAIIALVVSIISIYKSHQANSIANELRKENNDLQITTNKLQIAQVEMEIRSMISNAKAKFFELAKYANSGGLEQNQFQATLEEVCNAYDEACAKYLDGKIDKNRFKKTYSVEIRNWVSNECAKDKYVQPHTNFNATVKVYEEWNNLE